jgi:hypothetical protein
MYSWNPLLILEFSSSGHDDPLAVFLVLASIYLLLAGKRLSSAAAMGLAVLSKLFPILLVPIFLKRWGGKGSLLLAVLVVVFYAPFLLASGSVIAPVAVYVTSNRSEFNGGLFSVFQYLFQSLGANAAFDVSRAIEYSVFMVALALMTYKVLREHIDDIQLIRYAGIALTLYLALSSTVQPWYLAWVFVPFVVLLPTYSWILFSGAIFLTYYTFTQPPIQPGYWAEILWVKIVEYALLYGLIAYELFRHSYLKPRAHLPPQAAATRGLGPDGET